MPNKLRKSFSGSSTPAKSSETASVHSVTDSNDYIQCLTNYFKMPRDHSLPKAVWNENMEFQFSMTYADWRKSGEWNPTVGVEANWMRLASHLNSQWGKQFAWDVYHSKFTRMKKIWRLYVKLKGLRQSVETGIGWDENRRCFVASDSQWNNLQLENQDYKHFRYCQCVDKYAILSEVLDGETATGSQAHSSFLPPPQLMRQPRATNMDRQAFENCGDDVDGALNEHSTQQGSKWTGKRPASSQVGTSSFQGSRGSKSSKSSDNPFVECATSLSNLASVKLQICGRRETVMDKYDVTIGAQVVESFTNVHPGRKVIALLKLQDDKWRRTHLCLNRELQEYWLNSLEIAPINDGGGQ